MKIVYRKPKGNGESVEVECIAALVDGRSIVASDDEGSIIAELHRDMWVLRGSGDKVAGFAIQESSPSSIAIAVRAERARAAGIAHREAALASETLTKDGLLFKEKIAAEVGSALASDIEAKILYVDHEGLEDNPWQTALSRITQAIRTARDNAKTEPEAAAIDELVKAASSVWNEARRRERGS